MPEENCDWSRPSIPARSATPEWTASGPVLRLSPRCVDKRLEVRTRQDLACRHWLYNESVSPGSWSICLQKWAGSSPPPDTIHPEVTKLSHGSSGVLSTRDIVMGK